MSILKRIPMDEISAAASIIWLDESIASIIALETAQIISQTYARKFSFFSGKSAKYIIGGLFYLLGYRYNIIKRQYELADKLGTNDVTISASYRKWLVSFPDLFLDVISKFASDNAHRSFVLLELNQSLRQSESKGFRLQTAIS